MKKFLIGLLVMTLMTTILSGCQPEENAKSPEQVLATIEGKEVDVKEALFFVYNIQSQFGEEYMSEVNPYGEGTVGDFVKEQALDTTVIINLIEHIADEMNITLTKEEKEEQKANAKAYFESLDAAVIEENGFELGTIEGIMSKYALLNKVYEKEIDDSKIDQEKLKSDLESYAKQDVKYDSIQKYGAEGSAISVRARHILIKTIDDSYAPLPEAELEVARNKAKEALERVRANEDFATLVREYSQDEGSIETGGEYTFSRGEFVPEFEEAAYSMEPGEISDLIESQFGYHIIKVEEKDIAPTKEQIEEREQYQKDVEEQFKTTQKQILFDEKITEWRETYKIDIDEELWENIKVVGQTNADGTIYAPEPKDEEAETPEEGETPEETETP